MIFETKDKMQILQFLLHQGDIFIPMNTIVGKLQQIKHITALKVKRKVDISTV